MKQWVRALLAFLIMIAVSGLVRIYGLEDVLFFNKRFISAAVFFLAFFTLPAAAADWRKKRRTFWISCGFSAMLSFTEILGMSLRLDYAAGGVVFSVGSVLWMAGSALLFGLLLEPLMGRLMEFSIDSRRTVFSQARVFWLAWAMLFVGYLPCLLAFYPGLYSYDMIWQWGQYVSGDYSTHHPLVHTVFSGWLIETGKALFGTYNRGLFFHSLVQLLIMSGCMAWVARFLAKRRAHPGAIVLTAAFFLLYPFFPVLGISTTKDVIFGCLFLAVFVCICDMMWERRFYRGWKLAAFFTLAVLMCLFRNNAVYGLAVMFGCLLLVFLYRLVRRQKNGALVRAMALMLAVMAGSQCMFTVLEKGLRADQGSKAEMMSLPMQQMARSYVYHQAEFTPDEKEALLTYFAEDGLLQYKYWVSDPVKAQMDMEAFDADPAGFFRIWAELGKKFPSEYLKATLYNTFGLWYMGGDSSCYMQYTMMEPFDDEHVVETRSFLPWLKAYHSWFTDTNIQKYLPGISLFFYTSFYSWCIALCAGVLLQKRRYELLLLPLFPAAYGFTLIFGPCLIPRYCLGMILCVPVLADMAFEASDRNAPDPFGPESGGIQNPDGSGQPMSGESCP